MSNCVGGPFGDYLCQNIVKLAVSKLCVEMKYSRKSIAFVLPHAQNRDWKYADTERRVQRIVILRSFICLQRSKWKVDLSKSKWILKYCKTYCIVLTLEICKFLGSETSFYENIKRK